MEQSRLNRMSADDRSDLIRRLHQTQNSLCYICQKVINLQVHKVDVDHIIARSRGGPDDESNWALTHLECNRAKGARDLRLQRIISHFKQHVEKYSSSSAGATRNFTVHDALQELVPNRQEVGVDLRDDTIRISYNRNGQPETREYQLIVDDEIPEFRSFVGMIPFVCLHHDPDVNPRSIVDLEPLIEEFYSGNPQLQPSLATLDVEEPRGVGKIMLFDGQHKAAAQLYVGKPALLVRVFINVDKERLKETNFRAHTKLAQIHFPQLVNDRVGADLFSEEFDRWLSRAEPAKKSEQDFFDDLDPQQRSDFRTYFQSYLRYQILTGTLAGKPNRLLDFVETVVARSKKYPLSYETVQRTLLNEFVFLKPASEPLEETQQFRGLERDNLITLMNIFVEEVLGSERYDPRRGIFRIEETLLADPDSIPESHLRAYRICRKAPMVVWCKELARAARVLLNTRLRYKKGAWAENRPLWCEMKPVDWDSIRKMIRAIRDHKVWSERNNTEILRAMTSQTQRDWEEILLNGRLPGREQQLFPKLDQNFIFQAALKE